MSTAVETVPGMLSVGTTWMLATEVLLGALFWRKGRCDSSRSLRAPSRDRVRKGGASVRDGIVQVWE